MLAGATQRDNLTVMKDVRASHIYAARKNVGQIPA